MAGAVDQQSRGGAAGALIKTAAATGLMGNQIIDLGWRQAWNQLGVTVLAVTIPAALLIRDPGALRIRGRGRPTTSNADDEARPDVGGATLFQAIRTPCFWVFAASISFFGLISSGLSLFNQYVIAERGFDESVYHHTLVIGLLAGLVANLGTGAAAKRVPMRSLLAAALCGLSAALGVFPWVDRLWQVYAYAVTMGCAGGMLTVLFFTVWKHAFGQQHLGAIQGAAQMVTVLASAMGPVLVTLSQMHTGSYTTVFVTASIVSAAGAVAAALTPVPDAAWDD